MKKRVAILLSVLLALGCAAGLAACGGEDNKGSNDNNQSTNGGNGNANQNSGNDNQNGGQSDMPETVTAATFEQAVELIYTTDNYTFDGYSSIGGKTYHTASYQVAGNDFHIIEVYTEQSGIIQEEIYYQYKTVTLPEEEYTGYMRKGIVRNYNENPAELSIIEGNNWGAWGSDSEQFTSLEKMNADRLEKSLLQDMFRGYEYKKGDGSDSTIYKLYELYDQFTRDAEDGKYHAALKYVERDGSLSTLNLALSFTGGKLTRADVVYDTMVGYFVISNYGTTQVTFPAEFNS